MPVSHVRQPDARPACAEKNADSFPALQAPFKALVEQEGVVNSAVVDQAVEQSPVNPEPLYPEP